MADLSPEVNRLALAAMRAARWLPQGDLFSGCVHDSRDAVMAEVLAAVRACRVQAETVASDGSAAEQ